MSRKEREKERRKQQILQAAEDVFRRKGYQSTTMDEVAEEAEFSKGTLYLYFGSKFALFAELSNRVLSKVLQEFTSIAQTPTSGREMITRMLHHWSAEMSSNIRRFRLAISWMASDELHDAECPGVCAHRETVRQIIGALATAIVRGQEDGSIGRAGDAATIGAQLWSGMVGAMLVSSRIEETAAEHPSPVDCAGFMEGFIDLLSSGLAAKSIEE